MTTKKVRGALCGQCPLADDKYTLVVSKGPRDPEFIVVGEGPGKDEAHYQHNFVGKSGVLLRQTLQQYGLDPDRGYYANATLCWPRTLEDKEDLLKDAVPACKGQLRGLLNLLPDVPVLALGEWAHKALGLTTAERWEREKLSSKWALGAKHPAACLYEPTLYFTFSQAVKKFAAPRQIYSYPGTMAYRENPYPLPDINYWEGKRICLDIETTKSAEWRDPDNHIFLLGLAVGDEQYIFTQDYLQLAETQAWLRALYTHLGQHIGGHNFKFDILKQHQEFNVPVIIGWDTMLMVNVLHESWHKGLKELATWFYDVDDYEYRLVKSYLKRFKKASDKSYARVPNVQIKEYLMNDIVYNLWLARDLEKLLKEVGRWEMPYQQHEIPQTNMLAQVELTGFAVDTDTIAGESAVMGQHISFIQEQVQRLSDGVIVKPGSYLQIRKYLYDGMGRPVKNRTPKGEPSTDETTLKEHDDLPAIQALLFWRRVSKLKNSYLDNITKFIYPDKFGVPRVHPNFKAANVITHRLSAEHPAIQTIPHKDDTKDTIPEPVLEGITELHGEVAFDGDYGTRIKRCYVAPPGHILIGVDGSGWEVATATLQSKDKFLAAAFNAGESPHSQICEMLYGRTYTKAQKVKEKNVLFGWMYMGSLKALVYETQLPEQDVQEVMDFLDANLVGLKQWRLRMVEGAKKGGNVVPFFNYKNHFDLVTPQGLRDLEKHAVNYINQGLGSMIICRAAYQAQADLARLGTNIVVLVHDDYTVEAPIKNAVPVAERMMKSIADVGCEITNFIPLTGELKVGYRWGDMQAITLEELPGWLTKQ